MSDRSDDLGHLVAAAESATSVLTDPEFRRIAFEKVLDHLLASNAPTVVTRSEHTDPADVTPGTVHQDADGALASDQQRADALAHYFQISPEDVRHIFGVERAEPELILSPSRLAESSAVATREIALLITGARTALGKETTTAHIRKVADYFGKLDGGNFMSTVAKMSEISVLGKPKSPNRVVRMRATGAEAAQELSQRITSE